MDDGSDWIFIVIVRAQRDDVVLRQKEDTTVLASGGMTCQYCLNFSRVALNNVISPQNVGIFQCVSADALLKAM